MPLSSEIFVHPVTTSRGRMIIASSPGAEAVVLVVVAGVVVLLGPIVGGPVYCTCQWVCWINLCPIGRTLGSRYECRPPLSFNARGTSVSDKHMAKGVSLSRNAASTF